jgi:anti-repressor protein
LIRDLAKLIKQNGVDIGQNRLFEWLRNKDYLIKSGSDKNMPTQKAMNMNLLEIKEGSYINGQGANVVTRTPKVTGKGQIYFINKFLGNKED